MTEDLIKSNDYFEPPSVLKLNRLELASLVKFFFESGWITRDEGYDSLQDILFRLKIQMDVEFPGWEPKDLLSLVKELGR